MADQQNYDIIVIGSGIGSLAAAAIMAKACGKRVLVLEQHFQLGGYTHGFRRNYIHHIFEHVLQNINSYGLFFSVGD